MIVSNGWQVPTSYDSSEKEAAAARAGLGLADVSAGGKVSFGGRGVPALVQNLAPDSPAMKPLGVTWFPGAESTLACRLTEEHLLLLSLTSAAPPAQLELPGQAIVTTDVTSGLAGFLLVGPHTDELLRGLTHLDVRHAAFPVNSCAETSLAGVEALLVRSLEASVPTMRIYVAWDMAEYGWERLMETGRRWGILPIGLEALPALRGSED
jgi:aminomethyltransferase